ncbi:SDR family oxidoreductase [Nocardioides sp.]|uniref:SDR family oxidoreductase n=1 Tax=Nocardioides sp. TaxID=35761 RepID=UPI0035148A64
MTSRTVLVTGAAAGIGRAIAKRFHAAGYLVGAFDIDEAGLETLAKEFDDERVVTGRLDVRDADAWTAALAQLTEVSGGRLDVLVNNAGLLEGGRFADIPLERQVRQIDVNVTGVVTGCYTAHRFLKATPGAHVINLASASAIYGQSELATYSATKFAVRGLTEALDIEWAADDITVRAVWPLFVATQMTQDLDIGSTRSLGVRLTADDVADTVFDMVSPNPVTSRVGRFRRPVHRPVGTQAKVLFSSSGFAPQWVLRAVNGRITKGH